MFCDAGDAVRFRNGLFDERVMVKPGESRLSKSEATILATFGKHSHPLIDSPDPRALVEVHPS